MQEKKQLQNDYIECFEDKYQICNFLNKGSFAQCYKVIEKDTGNEYAC